MRISDWSSDVCSSDLPRSRTLSIWRGAVPLRATAKRQRSRNLVSHHQRPFQTPARFSMKAVMPPLRSRSEEHTSELQSLMRISYAVCGLKKHSSQLPYFNDTALKQHTHTDRAHVRNPVTNPPL